MNVCMNCGQWTSRRHKHGDEFHCPDVDAHTNTDTSALSIAHVGHSVQAAQVVEPWWRRSGVGPGDGWLRIRKKKQRAKDGHRLRRKQERQPAPRTTHTNTETRGGVGGAYPNNPPSKARKNLNTEPTTGTLSGAELTAPLRHGQTTGSVTP
jgi:hypothetical protein